MKKFKSIAILFNLLLVGAYFAYAVAQKEKTLDNGKLVLLKLEPVDPRSLMQGDYMRLNYQINSLEGIIDRVPFRKSSAKSKNNTELTKRGYCIVKLDSKGIATRQRLQPNITPLRSGEVPIKYFSSGSGYRLQMHIGAESYFFEEGQARKYSNAAFGGIKVDEQGNSILIGMYNKHGNLIK